MQPILLRNLCKGFSLGEQFLPVLQGLNAEISPNGITGIIGSSGCGKTTLLRILAGLEKPDAGEICFPDRETVGMVFQEPRLMPWLNCRENLAFGMRKPWDESKICSLLETVGLCGFEKAYPAQLSGGMQQRCALGRTLAIDPAIILLDEPFAALDAFTRADLQQELLSIQESSRKKMILVTHDIEEALFLSDEIFVIGQGQITAHYTLPPGRPRDIQTEPFLTVRRSLRKRGNETGGK